MQRSCGALVKNRADSKTVCPTTILELEADGQAGVERPLIRASLQEVRIGLARIVVDLFVLINRKDLGLVPDVEQVGDELYARPLSELQGVVQVHIEGE